MSPLALNDSKTIVGVSDFRGFRQNSSLTGKKDDSSSLLFGGMSNVQVK